jgi:hypothetical protein
MAQQLLHDYQPYPLVQQLCRQTTTQRMATDPHPCVSCIVLYMFLHAANGEAAPFGRPFLADEESPYPWPPSLCEIRC